MQRICAGPIKRAFISETLLMLGTAIIALCCSHPAAAQGNNSPQSTPARPSQAASRSGQSDSVSGELSPAHKYFTDVVLVNQNGEKMRFYSDLLKGKVVIIDAFFATCQGSCLPMNRNLEKLQDMLGDRLGKDVHIISISVDPTVDTPASLKKYANALHARPGWFFLTGDKKNVDYALYKVGQYVENKQDHLNIFIIGNESTGLWKKAFGLANSADLFKIVESVMNDSPTGGK